MEQITNKEVLEKLNQILSEITIIKERLPEVEVLPSVEEQLEMGLRDIKEGKIMRLA